MALKDEQITKLKEDKKKLEREIVVLKRAVVDLNEKIYKKVIADERVE